MIIILCLRQHQAFLRHCFLTVEQFFEKISNCVLTDYCDMICTAECEGHIKEEMLQRCPGLECFSMKMRIMIITVMM